MTKVRGLQHTWWKPLPLGVLMPEALQLHAAGRHRGDVVKAVMAAKARVKDPDSARAMEADMLEANEYLELNAAMSMAAMLLVRSRASFAVKAHACP